MNSHELAKILLSKSDKKVTLSLDISTCDEDAFARIFSIALVDVIHTENHKETTLLFIDPIYDTEK
jgi:hypothetical protein